MTSTKKQTKKPIIPVLLSPTNLIKKIEEYKGKLTTIKFIKESTKEERIANGVFYNRTTLGNIQFKEYKHMKTKKEGLLEKFQVLSSDDFLKTHGKESLRRVREYHEYTQVIPKNIIEVRVAGNIFLNNKKDKSKR